MKLVGVTFFKNELNGKEYVNYRVHFTDVVKPGYGNGLKTVSYPVVYQTEMSDWVIGRDYEPCTRCYGDKKIEKVYKLVPVDVKH